MSHIRVRTKYKDEGSYGSIDEKYVYAHHNLSCDYITFYNENGEVIMSIPDTIEGNLLDAINKLYYPHRSGGSDYELREGIEYYKELPNERSKEISTE